MVARHRVLIMDDYVEAAIVTRNLIVSLGHDARAEFELADNTFEPDLVLVVLRSGGRSAEKLAEVRHRVNRPVIVAGVSAEERHIALGFDFIITMPAEAGAIRQALWHAWVHRPSEAQRVVM